MKFNLTGPRDFTNRFYSNPTVIALESCNPNPNNPKWRDLIPTTAHVSPRLRQCNFWNRVHTPGFAATITSFIFLFDLRDYYETRSLYFSNKERERESDIDSRHKKPIKGVHVFLNLARYSKRETFIKVSFLPLTCSFLYIFRSNRPSFWLYHFLDTYIYIFVPRRIERIFFPPPFPFIDHC